MEDPPGYDSVAVEPQTEEEELMQEESATGIDSDELRVILSTLSAFYLYRRASHRTTTHARRTAFYALPTSHQEILKNAPINYLATLDAIDECIENNAAVSEAILATAGPSFGVNLELSQGWKDLAGSEDLDKVRSTIKQFYRDWSAEGAGEREKCYGPVLEEIDKRFGGISPRHQVEVLVPGAGLGRLAFEVVRRGYASQGNEFSYHQLMASNWILNHAPSKDVHTIHPFISSFSNHLTRANQLRPIKIPDVHPASELLRTIDTPSGEYRPADHFSMIAGDFVSAYNNADSAETFDCVASVFFIDTASNLLTYLETIKNVLKQGGVWINLGPLLWHWEGRDMTKVGREAEGPQGSDAPDYGGQYGSAGHEHSHEGGEEQHGHSHDHSQHEHSEENLGSFELTLDEVLYLVESFGFRIEKRHPVQTGYIEDDVGMMKWDYTCEFWVAVKL